MPEGHLAWFVLESVEQLDLSAFYGSYRVEVMVEPVFAQAKHNRRINQFQRRGRSAARSEWRLITATHNLLKLHKHQIAAHARA